jgi:hypothetical protein
VLAAVVAVILTSGSSGSPRSAANRAPSTSHHHAGSVHAAHAPAAPAPAAAQLHVVVLNSTEINGLAHRLATTLQERGFRQAQALGGRPAGTYSTSVVEYAPGYTSQAESVARALGLEAGAVRSMESATQSLTPGASVVVVAAGNEAAGGSTG